MSAAELAAPPRLSTRFFRSELVLIFGRRRNWFGLAVLAAVPVLIAVVLRIDNPTVRGGTNSDFLASITDSGVFVALAAGLWRIVLCVGYLSVCLCALGAVGLFVSTLTEQPVGATIATAALAVTSQILDALPQLDRIHAYLLTDHWMAYGDLLRDPMATGGVRAGLVSALVYVLLFGSAAWARLGSRDVTC
jgi:ABC-2 type transport system permease protein